MALRVTNAGTWETWEDELTFDRLTSLRKSIELCPPEFMLLHALAIWAGAVKTPDVSTAASDSSPGKKDALSTEQFVSLFGGGGELGATGTFH